MTWFTEGAHQTTHRLRAAQKPLLFPTGVMKYFVRHFCSSDLFVSTAVDLAVVLYYLGHYKYEQGRSQKFVLRV